MSAAFDCFPCVSISIFTFTLHWEIAVRLEGEKPNVAAYETSAKTTEQIKHTDAKNSFFMFYISPVL